MILLNYIDMHQVGGDTGVTPFNYRIWVLNPPYIQSITLDAYRDNSALIRLHL